MIILSLGGSQKQCTKEGAKIALSYASEALEASVRYLAADLGPDGIRVNAISAGPIRTLAASGVPGFRRMYREFDKIAPLRESITNDDIGSAAAWLCSDKAAKTTEEVLYIDSGYNILGLSVPDDLM